VTVDHLRLEPLPSLRRPAVMYAFRGWNDGGEAATGAVGYLRDRWEARRVGEVDPEEFFDFQVTRPSVRLEDGATRRIEWPPNELFHAALPSRDVILFLGIEPNVRWRTFIDTLMGAAREVGAEDVLTLGAFLADVPHTLPSPVTGSAADPEQARQLGLASTGYEGPTGIVGVLHDAAVRAGYRAASLWTAVPHYLPGGPNPRATLALVERAAGIIGVEVETDTLDRAAASWEQQVTEGIADNAELRSYVEHLERNAQERKGPPDMPSGDDLAQELEDFLRRQRGEG
jgi:predicted ATP-grasp superfamily ATP-dependent carboligase